MFEHILPNGMDGQSCSYTAKFIADTVKDFKAIGVSEAKLQDGLVKGHWGVVAGKAMQGTLKEGTVLLRGKGIATSSVFKDAEMRVTYAGNGQIKKAIFKNGNPVGSPVTIPMDSFEALYVENPVPGKWDMRLPTQKTPPVGSTSASVGSITDEDAAILFVKTKDDFAKAKGINIKGANPQLDVEVYDSIAKVTGYSAKEIQAKVEAYKASGKKLSALKKKVIAGKAQVKTPAPVSPPPPPPAAAQSPIGVGAPKVNTATASPVNPTLAEANPIDGFEIKKNEQWGFYETYMDGNKTASFGQDTLDSTKWVVSFYDEHGDFQGSDFFPSKMAAAKEAEDWAKKLKPKLTAKVQPPKVHTAPSQPAVQQAVKDLKAKDAQQALAYKDEDVVKAYIKAKDTVAADPNNPFTLYSKGEQFDDIIQAEMEVFGVKLPMSRINKHLADYLGTGQKLSVLKKKMIKSGELKPQADTLKKTKAQQQHATPPTQSAAEAKQQVAGMAESKVDPVGAQPYSLDGADEDNVFTSLKNTIYAGMSQPTAYEHFAKKAAEMSIAKGQKVSALDVIRAYDKKKASQLGITNGQFYEKKVAEWAASPQGRAELLAKQKAAAEAAAKQAQAIKDAAEKAAKEAKLAAQINENIPDLPPDSVKYQVISVQKATEQQNRLRAWTAEEKSGLRHYTGGSYHDMNDFLRGNTSYISDTNRRMTNAAMDGMRAQEEEFLVRRGCNYRQFGVSNASSYGFDITGHMDFKALIGKTVQDKGFTSTSVGGDGAFGGAVKLEVEIAKGTHGAFVDHISMHRGEREFIVAPGTQYKVLRVEKVGNQTVVRVRTIPGSHDTRRF